jgi:hypothetical protein
MNSESASFFNEVANGQVRTENVSFAKLTDAGHSFLALAVPLCVVNGSGLIVPREFYASPEVLSRYPLREYRCFWGSHLGSKLALCFLSSRVQ